MELDHARQVIEAISLGEMLIDRHAGQEGEAAFVAFGHHVGLPSGLPRTR